MSTGTDPSKHAPHSQETPAKEVKRSKAGARGVRAGGNAGAMGDPVGDQSKHNYQVSRDTDMTQHAGEATRYQEELQAAKRREEIDDARINKIYDL